MRRIGLGFAALFLFSAAWVHAQSPFDAFQQFSASASGGPLKWAKKKVYRSGNQWRADYASENEFRFSNRKERNGWVVRPLDPPGKPKECARMTLMDATTYPFFTYSNSDYTVERVPATSSPAVEKETIDGHPTSVANYLVKQKEGVITIKVKLWEAEDLKGFPVQMEIEPSSRPKFTFNYSDVSLDRPDPKLFQLPAICHAGAPVGKKPAAAAPKKPGAKSPAPPK